MSTQPAPPRIATAAAEQLAASSDAVADALDAGDVCLAAGRADELLDQVVAAIQAGDVPPRFQEDLTARANELVNTVNCPEPEPEQEKTDDDEIEAENEKKNKKDKKNEQEEQPLPTDELPPVEP